MSLKSLFTEGLNALKRVFQRLSDILIPDAHLSLSVSTTSGKESSEKVPATRCNQEGIDLIKQFEGLRTFAYQDQRGLWTIGYGSTLGVHKGMSITPEEACLRLENDLRMTERFLFLTIPFLNSNQFSACCSLIYNVGVGAFHKSNMFKYLMNQKFNLAAEDFLSFDHIDGKPNNGLLNRRKAERELFLKPV